MPAPNPTHGLSPSQFSEMLTRLNDVVELRVLLEPDIGATLRAMAACMPPPITECHSITVRLVNEAATELSYACTVKPATSADEELQIDDVTERDWRFPIEDPPRSVAALVYQRAAPVVIDDLADDPKFYAVTRPPNVSSLIATPIMAGGKVLGVLDVQFMDKSASTDTALFLASLLGQQLGLYLMLTDFADAQRRVVDALSEKADALATLELAHRTTTEDLVHQLTSPLLSLERLSQHLLHRTTDAEMQRQLLLMRGLCHKATTTMRTAELFTRLASGQPIRIAKKRVGGSEVQRLCRESSIAYEQLVSPNRQLRVVAEADSFANIVPHRFLLDVALVDQALSCLLDNAVKYSYEGTTVRVSAECTAGTLKLKVTSLGIPISGDEVATVFQRGWRGREAGMATGEGSGIGLWVADGIMRAHGGTVTLESHPDLGGGNRNVTHVLLSFPDAVEHGDDELSDTRLIGR